MLIFDPQEVNAPRWFTFQPGVRVMIAPVNRQVRRDLRKKAMAEGGPDLHEQTMDSLIRRHMVRDWEGICSPDGAALPCTPPNIDAVLAAFGVLEDWVSGHAATMAENEARSRADALKNSRDSHDGPQPDQKA